MFRFAAIACLGIFLTSCTDDSNPATGGLTPPVGLEASALSDSQIRLNWSLHDPAAETVVQRFTPGSADWTIAGVAAPGLTRFTGVGLSEGLTYRHRLLARFGEKESAPSAEVAVQTGPKSPDSLRIAISEFGVTFNWRDNSSVETAFELQQSSGDASSFERVTDFPGNAAEAEILIPSAESAYFYRLRALIRSVPSLWSDTVSAVIAHPPQNFQVPSFTAESVRLQWSDNSAGELGYSIERAVGVSPDFIPLAQVPANTVEYTDFAVAEGMTLTYRILKLVPGGASDPSPALGLTTPPNSPVWLFWESDTNAEDSFTIFWTDRSAIETGYTVDRRQSGEAFRLIIAELPANSDRFTDSGLNEGITYFYTVSAIVADLGMSTSEELELNYVLRPPAGLQASIDPNRDGMIHLVWENHSDAATSFFIERRVGAGPFEALTHIPAVRTDHTDLEILRRQTYGYRVRAERDGAFSLWSNEAVVTSASRAPGAPTGLGANLGPANRVRLTWISTSTNELGFVAERRIAGSQFFGIDSVSAGVEAYEETPPGDNTTYDYRVFAFNSFGNSGYSNTALITTGLRPPNAPTDLRGSAESTEISLIWRDNSNDEQGFPVQRRDSVNGAWRDLVTVPASGSPETSFNDRTVSAGRSYAYRVAAFRFVELEKILSAWSNELSITAEPGLPAPSGVTALFTGIHQITLGWNSPPSAVNIRIERRVEAHGDWALLATVAATPTGSYPDETVLQGGLLHEYRLLTIGASGSSGYSEIASARTYAPSQPYLFTADFENQQPGLEPNFPWAIGGDTLATILVFNGDAHAGTRSLALSDSGHSNEFPAELTLYINSPLRAYVRQWLRFSQGFFYIDGISVAADTTAEFSLLFETGGVIRASRGAQMFALGGVSLPSDAWFMLEIFFDAEQGEYWVWLNGDIIIDDWQMRSAGSRSINELLFRSRNSGAFDNKLLDDFLLDDVEFDE